MVFLVIKMRSKMTLITYIQEETFEISGAQVKKAGLENLTFTDHIENSIAIWKPKIECMAGIVSTTNVYVMTRV